MWYNDVVIVYALSYNDFIFQEEKFMKRVLSLAIVLMLAFSCVFTAFAQTDDTATPDEAKR